MIWLSLLVSTGNRVALGFPNLLVQLLNSGVPSMYYLVTSSMDFGSLLWNQFISCCWYFLIISQLFGDFTLDGLLLLLEN